MRNQSLQPYGIARSCQTGAGRAWRKNVQEGPAE